MFDKPPTQPPEIKKQKKPYPPELEDKAFQILSTLLQKNRVPANQIVQQKIDGEIIEFDAILNIDIKPETAEKIVSGESQNGEVVPSGSAKEKAQGYIASLYEDGDFVKNIQDTILKREDKGFGVETQTLSLPIEKTYIEHFNCSGCQGNGRTSCGKCQGSANMTCYKCSGSTRIFCKMCKGDGVSVASNGDKQSCYHCQGHGTMLCDSCRGSGRVPCTSCGAQGLEQCKGCAGTGRNSKIVFVKLGAELTFAPALVEMEKVVREFLNVTPLNRRLKAGDISIEFIKCGLNPHKILQMSYRGFLPFARMELSVSGKDLNGTLLGYRPRFTGFPTFMDKILTPAHQLLADAAQGLGMVDEKIKKAAEYSLVHSLIKIVHRESPRKAAQKVYGQTACGLSKGFVSSLANNAHLALKKITKKARYIALGVGVTLSALISFLWFGLNQRTAIYPDIDKIMPVGAVIDCALLGALIGLTVLFIRFFAFNNLKKNLAELGLGDKGTKWPKAGKTLPVAFGLIPILFIACALFASAEKPAWANLLGL